MQTTTRHPLPIRFADFKLDTENGELSNAAGAVRLGRNPLEVLLMLLEQPGATVTREEMHARIWPGNTFVDFEDGLNHAVRKLRESLGDSADHPRFIETVPRHGYRFITPVEGSAALQAADDEAGRMPALRPPDVGAHGSAPAVAPVCDRRSFDDKKLPAVPDRIGAGIDRRYSRWRLVAAFAGAIVAIVAVFLVFNVAGLRDKLMAAVGASSARPREGGALPYPKIESIAVLPLENLSGDPAQEYFADGMTEELITNLGKVSALRVISRTSVMRYKGTKTPLPEIAKELKVDAVVEGAVLRSGDRVRITANLIHASTDHHLWAEAYDRDLRDVLSMQGDVARAIAQQVNAKLTPQDRTRIASARPVDPVAFELYLKGNDFLRRDQGFKALEYFQQAIEKDPKFAMGFLGVARTYFELADAGQFATVEASKKQEQYARKALDLDGSLEGGHVQIALAQFRGDWDWSGAEREFKQALDLNPNSEPAHDYYSFYLLLMGRFEEGIAEAKRLIEISPMSARPYGRLGYTYYFARRYDEALPLFFKRHQMSPVIPTHLMLGWTYREQGRYADAIGEFLQLPEIPPKFGHLGNTYARAGKKVEAQENLKKLAKLYKQEVGAYDAALIYAGLGDKDRAFEWLDRAYKIRDKGLTWLKVDPPLDPLRSDPRFQDLLRRMNFPP